MIETYSELTGISGSILEYTEYEQQALESRIDNKISFYKANKFSLSDGPLQNISDAPSDFTIIKIQSGEELDSDVVELMPEEDFESTRELLNYIFRLSSQETEDVIDAILVDTKNSMIRSAASLTFSYDFKFSENLNAYISGSHGSGGY
tara:strand:+ start:78 stop:524 length:447 start_codon:yes stop_codon:yes gene_type:complete